MAKESQPHLAEALGIQSGSTVGVFNAPNYMDVEFGDLPDGVTVHREERPSDVFLVFAERVEEAERQVERIATLLRPEAAIWILWGDTDENDENPEMTLEGLCRVLEPLELTSDKSAQVGGWLAVSFVPFSAASAES